MKMSNHRPIILSTWSFGKRANAAAWGALAAGGAAVDAVEAACRDAERDPNNHTVGVGGYPDRSGRVSLDASIMLSPSQRGAVGFVRDYPHPISIARRVMEKTEHVLLTGAGAEEFAHQQGFETAELLTEPALHAWEAWRQSRGHAIKANIEEHRPGDLEGSHDTIGVLALDTTGTMAGGCTTSGMRFKLPGRVGDSPIVGHALYVQPGIGAAVCTGHGELVMGVCGSFLAVECLRRGASANDAAMEVIQRIGKSYALTGEDQVGVIVLQANGAWGCAAIRQGFSAAVRTKDRDELVKISNCLFPIAD